MARLKLILIMCFGLAGVLSANQILQAQDFSPPPDSSNARYELYERQLNAILKTRRDEEKLFVKQVVDQVKKNRLPAKLVNTSFEWGRKNRPFTKYPFVYFERVLRLQAKKLGLKNVVPPFDYGIYSQ